MNNVLVLQLPLAAVFGGSSFEYYVGTTDGALRWPGDEEWKYVVVF